MQQSCARLCRLVKDYMGAAPGSAVADMVEMLAGPNILHMVHSHAGADVACRVLALGTAKQRKKVIKAMKGERSCSFLHLSSPLLSQRGGHRCDAGPSLQTMLGRMCFVLQSVGGAQVLRCIAPKNSTTAAEGCHGELHTAEAATCCCRACEGDG